MNIRAALSAIAVIFAATVAMQSEPQQAPAQEQAPAYEAQATSDGVTAEALGLPAGAEIISVTETVTSSTATQGNSRGAFMTRGPARRFISRFRSRRLERISKRRGHRGRRAQCLLCNMSARGVR